MSLSKIVVSGKVIKAPEKRFTPSNNVAVTEFIIAVESLPRGDAPPETTPVKITTWRDLAERCAQDIKKGDPVVVEGRLQINNFVTAEGLKRKDIEIDAGSVENLANSVAKLTGGGHHEESEFAAVAVSASTKTSSAAAEKPGKSSDDLASIFASDDEIPF